uniref:NB-ARC domain containing disease resistance protein n=1 Tax=Arabidopsis thaliana TaxID=3702 RepID=A0A221J438_ARATH|nr:NB-ARC domain containing disease resistance protein [Arabidopsis thaliana]ASM61061.1 NB-ARC domain containing disease resistance protein [Arabidopsis thaliana]ASM61062.1 NB-ARC domain containing disease resistance protein [Arabidopsis thaliana]
MEKQDQISREEIIKKIMDSLGQDGVPSKTVLVGEAGIGKTWLAKEVCQRVTKEKYNILWLHLNKRIDDEKSLYEILATQLSIIYEFEEGEEPDELDYPLESLKEKIKEEMIRNKKDNLLLILDDEGSMTTEENVMHEINLQDFLKDYSAVKILVTRRDEREEKESTTIKVGPLTEKESLDILRDAEDLLASFTIEAWRVLLQRLCDNREIDDPTLMSCILSKSKGLPAAIVVLIKSLNSIKSLSAKQRKIFKELILSSKSLDEAAASKNAIDRSRYNPVLRLSYELLKPDETVKRPMIACFWHILDFYKYSGCAYYRDLIVHWMLEGYFDPVKSVEKAYQEGHSILMDFMNRGILKIQEDNMVVPEFSMSNLLDLQDCGFFGRSSLGFDRVYGGDKRKGLGKIILIDDMIQTIQSKKKNITTIIASGNRLRREVHGKFFEKPEMQDLEVVVLFEPTFHELVLSLSKLKKLRVLVIRDCDLIDNIDKLSGLQGLHVLEVSGASSLVNIPDDFFKNMTQLQSLNLSGLAIKSSPSTIEKLSMLRCFILRHCSELQDLPNFIVETRKLEVIDIHGAKKLESYFDRVKDWKDYKGKNKNFAQLQLLEHLDFSETKIIRLPIFHLKDSTNDFSTMPILTRLLLRNCTRLKRLPQLRPLTNLQILDACGATDLVEMLEVCLEEKKELRILDMSKTSLPELADTIADVVNLNKLLLRNCSLIEELPSIEKLTHLEVFDVSGCIKLKNINGSFGEMSYLHEVNLSETNLSELPDKISELSNLKELIIRKCSKLKTLPNLEKLTNLEIFDVSGCTELETIEGSFENLSCLHKVNLSETNLGELPNKISELSNLKELILRNCSKLKALPNLEKLTHLEIFDVSGCTDLDKIEGSFENMSYLREVNLSDTTLKTFPELPKQSILCSSKRIVLADSSCIERDQWSQIKECLTSKSEGSSFSNVAEKPREKLLYHGGRYRVLDPEVPLNIHIVDIKRSTDLKTEYITKAEYVSIAENGSKNVSSIFEEFQMVSVKGCWVERCNNMDVLFESDEQQEKDKSSSSSSLETLWISNLPLLTSLYSSEGGFIFKNLKKLSVDCCPSIKSLFPEIPDNLETLRVKFCDKLERLFEVKAGELSKLRKLHLLDLPVLSVLGANFPNLEKCTIAKCPKLKGREDEPRITDEISEDQPHKNTIGPETQTPAQPTKATDTV